MIEALDRNAEQYNTSSEARLKSLIGYLRHVVFVQPERGERLHAIFLDRNRVSLEEVTVAWGGELSFIPHARLILAGSGSWCNEHDPGP